MIPIVNEEDTKDNKGKLDVKTDPIKNEYEDLLIASILHDIGKFWQRSETKYYRTAHEKLSALFVRNIGLNEQVENMVLSHMGRISSSNNKDKFLAEIIKKSDIFSSKEREGIEGTADTRIEPLISVFSNLKLNEKNDTGEYYYPVKKLERNVTFPVRSKKEVIGKAWNLQPSYEMIWKEFIDDTNKIRDKLFSFDTMFYILKKYTSFIPSAVHRSYPDISLYDHLKTTAAISSCLYQYILEKGVRSINEKTDYFIIISGNISGIQNFIYNISSPQFAQKGMAKRLRGRSFYINLLNENLARIIVERLELNDANILWCGGGYFLIIAPNTNKTENILKEYEKEVNEFLFKKYGGKLFLSLVSQPASGTDLDNFAVLKENILFENSRNKRQKYINNIDMIFKEEESIPPDVCKICGNSILDGDICKECDTHEDLGDKITRAEYMVRTILKDNTENKFDFQEFNVGYLLLKKDNLVEEIEKISRSSSKIQIFTLNNTDFLDREIIKKLEEKNIQASFGFSFLGNTVPSHEKYGPLYFEHIAKVSRGSKKLGILKMDVDNLGKLFKIGLGNTVSISRTSTMSSLLDVFISGYINELMNEYYILPDVCPECREKVDGIELTFFDKDNIKIYREKEREGKIEKVCDKCAKKKIPILYIGYSGGDDILIIGPWDIIVKSSKDIRDRFKKYTCLNPDINISAGINICDSKSNIGRSVIMSNDMLKKSKFLGRDRISIFGETVMWTPFDQLKGYDELLQFADQLERLIDSNKISHSFAYYLITLLRYTFRDLEELEYNKKIRARLVRREYVPILKYKLARTIKDKNIKEDLNKRLITERMFPWIEIPASIVSLKWR